MMMLKVIVVALMAWSTTAQVLFDILPVNSPICTAAGAGYHVVDKSAFYKSAFQGATNVCIKAYLDVCATPTGLVACNTGTSKCAPVGYSWNDDIQYPTVQAMMAQRPEICTAANAVRTAGTSVVLIAQIIISAVVLISAFIIFAVLVKCSPIIKVFVAVYLILCLILLFSYYYLNAIVIFTTVIAAAACFGFGSDRGFVLACALLLLGFFWVTYSDGLGYAQHHGRLVPAAMNFDYQSQLCDNYYDGFFAWPTDAHNDNQNILIQQRGICVPEWLAAELFFMILVEQLMIPFIAIAALLHFRNRKDDDHTVSSSSSSSSSDYN